LHKNNFVNILRKNFIDFSHFSKEYNLLKYSLSVLLLFQLLLFGQEKPQPIFIEHNSIISDSNQIEILSYKVALNNLLFIKNNGSYSTSFTLTFEIFKDEIFILREIVKPRYSVSTYDETLSKDKYYEDFIEIQLDSGKYNLKTVFSIDETEVEFRVPNKILVVDDLQKTKFIPPVVVLENSKFDSFKLANFSGNIPFSPNKYDLLFGVIDDNVGAISVTVLQFNNVIYSDSIFSFANGDMVVNNIDNNIRFSFTDSSTTNYFLAAGFSHLLYEGKADLIIKIDSTEKKYTLNTSWNEKPTILSNPEYAIKLLSYIADENIVGELLSASKDLYYKNLTEYWIKNYPADGMKFNYAMDEYYKRADHAIKNFSSLNSFDGAERDRGRIYILYGEPDSIERNYTEMNEIMEVWRYDKVGRSFVFKDVNGTGKFDLVD
jgi:GWxTD domain-containing protein